MSVKGLLALVAVLSFQATAWAGDCCKANDIPGCDDAAVQSCVCLQDSHCCQTKWDDACAGEVDSLGCGSCVGSGTCPGYTGSSQCCSTDDPCGYGGDGFCDCDRACVWDSGDCGGFCGDGSCSEGETCSTCPDDCVSCAIGDCCETGSVPGCDNQYIRECVCGEDADCCEVKWTADCAYEVEQFGCGYCGGCAHGCEGKQCGDDGCGGQCGSCAQEEVCVQGMCGHVCVPDCFSKECGDDGCGGACGDCWAEMWCSESTGLCESYAEDVWTDTSPEDTPEYSCPEGQLLIYGKCIPATGPAGSDVSQQEVQDSDIAAAVHETGCTTGASSAPVRALSLLLLALLLLRCGWASIRRVKQ